MLNFVRTQQSLNSNGITVFGVFCVFVCDFENVFSPKGWSNKNFPIVENPQMFGSHRLYNDFTYFHMQIPCNKTPLMDLNTSVSCFEGPRHPCIVFRLLVVGGGGGWRGAVGGPACGGGWAGGACRGSITAPRCIALGMGVPCICSI